MKLKDIHTELQSGILNYLASHPEAMGSVDHIAHNWLFNEKYEHTPEQVASAVNRMVERGELTPRLGGDLYSR